MNGFVLPAAAVGLGAALLIRPRRGFFPQTDSPFVAHAVLEEVHNDEMEITEHPVEQGASITDHAFKRPAEVIIRCAWSNSPPVSTGLIGVAVGVGATLGGPVAGSLAAAIPTVNAIQSLFTGEGQDQIKEIYDRLVQFQANRVLFDIVTGKRLYTSMLIRSLSVTTDKSTENVLLITVGCKQVILVATQPVVVDSDTSIQSMPEKTAPVQALGQRQLQSAPNFVSP